MRDDANSEVRVRPIIYSFCKEALQHCSLSSYPKFSKLTEKNDNGIENIV